METTSNANANADADTKAEAKTETQTVSHSFTVGEHDLVLRIQLRMHDLKGNDLVDISNAVKIERALGPYYSHATLRRIEKHLDLLAITPFVSAIGVTLREHFEKRNAEAAKAHSGVIPSAETDPEMEKAVEEMQSRLRTKAPWEKGPGSSPEPAADGPQNTPRGFFGHSFV